MWYRIIGTACLIAIMSVLSGCGGGGGGSTNHAPVAHDDTATATQGGAAVTIDVLANDTDEDNNTLSIKSGSLTSPNHGGTVTIRDGKVTYTPPTGYYGTETFQYTVSDGQGGEDNGTVTVAVNAPPVAQDDTATATRAGTAVTIDVLANDTDSNGNTLSIKSGSLTTPTHGGTATIGSGKITYTPPANYSGTETFNYTATDGHGGEDTATVTVTIAKAWGSPVLIGDGNTVDAEKPQVAALPNGDAIAVWLQDDGIHSQIRYSRFTAATGTWSAADTIAVGDSPADTPQVSVDSDGNILVIWTMKDSGHIDVMAKYYDASGSAWDSIKTVDVRTDDASSPQVAFDSQGDAFATWVQHGSLYDNIFVSHFTKSGGNWSTTPYAIDSNTSNANNPQMGYDGHDNLFIVWDQDSDNDGSTDIVYRRYSAGAWGLDQVIELDFDNAYKPQIAVDNDGNANVVWLENDGARQNIFSNRYDYGTSAWGAGSTLLENSDVSADSPDITVDSHGKATAVWSQWSQVYTNTYVPGSGWGGMVSVYSDNNSQNIYPQISANASGDTVAVWEQSYGMDWNIYANNKPEGSGTWGTAQVLENMSNTARSPQVAVDADGNAVVVWEHSVGTYWKIYANRFW